MNDTTIIAPPVTAAVLGSFLEVVEAFTNILAVGLSRVLSQTRFLLANASGAALIGSCRINDLAPLPRRRNGAKSA
jgi:hypothetical protein